MVTEPVAGAQARKYLPISMLISNGWAIAGWSVARAAARPSRCLNFTRTSGAATACKRTANLAGR